MLASPSPRVQDLAKRLTAFMEEHVYPAEAVFERQLREARDRWSELPVTAELSRQLKEWWVLHTLRPAGSAEALPLDDPESDPQRHAAVQMVRGLMKQQ